MEIKLTGWKGIVGAVVVAGFLSFRYLTAVETLDTEGSKAIQDWIASEYQRHHLSRSDLSDEKKAEILLQTGSVNLVSISARGRPELMAVRVEIEPNPAHPPGTPYVRYFNLEYSITSGWRHKGNISALQYHLTDLW